MELPTFHSTLKWELDALRMSSVEPFYFGCSCTNYLGFTRVLTDPLYLTSRIEQRYQSMIMSAVKTVNMVCCEYTLAHLAPDVSLILACIIRFSVC